MACFPNVNRKLVWSPLILILLAVSATIFSNVVIISRLFIRSKSRATVSPASRVVDVRKSDHIIQTHVPFPPALVPHIPERRGINKSNASNGKVADVQRVYKSYIKTAETAATYSNQTLPPNLRSGLLKPGTLEEAVARKLMSVRQNKIVNSHDFEYTINPLDACTNKKVEVVLCVVTAVNNFHMRHQFRYGINGGYSGIWNKVNKVLLLFFLGKPSDENSHILQVKVDNESQTYGDIVQATFIDTYRNLSIKTVSILKWVSMYCSHASFVVKTDDDCDVNIPLMITELRKKQQELPLFILGKVSRKLNPVRIITSKWYIPRSLYKEDKYPNFLYGGSQGYPTIVAKLLYEASLRIPTFFLEDVYISGLCASMLNIPRFDSTAFYFSHIPPPDETEY